MFVTYWRIVRRRASVSEIEVIERWSEERERERERERGASERVKQQF
jgi:hypothetical protein